MELNADTAMTVECQREQTRSDTEKLYKMNANLDLAEQHMTELEKPSWKIMHKPKQASKGTTWDREEDDTDWEALDAKETRFNIQMWKSVWTRFHHYTLEFSHAHVKRFNACEE